MPCMSMYYPNACTHRVHSFMEPSCHGLVPLARSVLTAPGVPPSRSDSDVVTLIGEPQNRVQTAKNLGGKQIGNTTASCHQPAANMVARAGERPLVLESDTGVQSLDPRARQGQYSEPVVL